MVQKKAPAELSKREKFERAGRFPIVKVAVATVLVVVIAVAGVTAYRLATRTPEVGGAVVEQGGADYRGASVAMTLLPGADVDAGTLKIEIADIKANKLVGVVYNRTTPMPEGYNDIQGNGLPLIAYVAPSGRLVVASSLCEPCHSYDFHIEGDELVCNACFTRWDLNTLEGKSGGCQGYPPAELTSVVQGDTVGVPVDVLESWLPRA